MPQEIQPPQYEEPIAGYLTHLYSRERSAHACRAEDPEGVAEWQASARSALRHLIGLESIAASAAGHTPAVELGDAEDMGVYARQRGTIFTEPGFPVPFWLLKPRGEGPFPLALTPHGHDKIGMDTSAGIAHSDDHRKKILEDDRDVAVQAAERGFVAIAPATRGLGDATVKDINGRHGARDCRCHFIHSILAGRTVIGERVWDMERLIDWASARPDVDPSRILMMGNSGGGVVTLYAAACEPRITVAIPSCSYCTLVGKNGLVHHCDCNAVPGILGFGECYDIAGLTAPRRLCIVNGKKDGLFPLHEVDRAVTGLREIYAAAGVPDRFEHKYGPEGHRFYKDLMWPFIEKALEKLSN